MKYFVIFIALVTLQAFGEAEKKDDGFEANKAKIIEILDKRLASIEEEKKCITLAKTKDDLKACRAKMKEEMGKMRDERRQRLGKKKEKAAGSGNN